MKKAVVISSNNDYVIKSIVALQKFVQYNKDYKKVIIGKKFSNEMKKICYYFNVLLLEVDLSKDFFLHANYKLQYPQECFYHFYSYKLLYNYDYIVNIEPDIYTNKNMDNYLHKVKYIGGTKGRNPIIKFHSIAKDYNKIKKILGNGLPNQRRILGGTRVYNVKNLKTIRFYEKIVYYYKISIKNNCPRLGDDSLMSLFQLFNSKYFFLFDFQFHLHPHFWYKNIKLSINYNKIASFHAVSHRKYWLVKDINKLNSIERFFHDNMMEFIYNNFSLDFIKKYLPEIYINIKNIKIPFYYYNDGNKNNFGDLITPYLLNKFCNKNNYEFSFKITTPKIISCGSIMRLCHEKTIVYGSGIRDIDQKINPGLIKIVRGPLTKKRLNEIGCYCPPIYGDPGLLLPLYYNPVIKKTHKIGIIPHYIHYNMAKKKYSHLKGVKVIKLVNKNIEIVIKEILSCEKTISSSLHGLIVSDAYNIPNKWVKFNNKINGDDTKYYDYFLSVNRKDINYINLFNFKKLPNNISGLIKNTNISFNKKYLQQNFFMDKNGIKNYTKYLFKKYILQDKTNLNNRILQDKNKLNNRVLLNNKTTVDSNKLYNFKFL